ncbi:hypothetical protein DFP74_2832 [Nocardiopsis sp. Huas11]|uniref:VOC family protein n=1 Tax=Nocardiopsis sp. Huas11 TaxID=2183912 RepID=UPI000EB2F1F0|nr:VOC family protein [Nocardiopsis sp. Huas11]RKS07175.1 hypothetical protein DFP74_2832 [Nocardiopsis sp. Huas11]
MPVLTGTLVVGLPIADRWRSMVFYRDAFGFAPLGDPAEDGVPEPLRFRLDERTLLMLIPTGGFGWVIGDGRQIAPPGVHESLLGLGLASESDVDTVIERAVRAGGETVTAPGPQPWGYSGVCADPDGHLWQITVEPPADS